MLGRSKNRAARWAQILATSTAMQALPGCGGEVENRGTASSGGAAALPAGRAGGNQNTGGSTRMTSSDPSSCTDEQFRAVVCANDPCCAGLCSSQEVQASGIVDCSLDLSNTPVSPLSVAVVLGCETLLPYSRQDVDSGLPSDENGWTIDYSTSPAKLVLGAQLCETVEARSQAPVLIVYGCYRPC